MTPTSNNGVWVIDPRTGTIIHLHHDLPDQRPVRPPVVAWVLLAFAGPLVALGLVLSLIVPGLVPYLIVVTGLLTMIQCAIAAVRIHDTGPTTGQATTQRCDCQPPQGHLYRPPRSQATQVLPRGGDNPQLGPGGQW